MLMAVSLLLVAPAGDAMADDDPSVSGAGWGTAVVDYVDGDLQIYFGTPGLAPGALTVGDEVYYWPSFSAIVTLEDFDAVTVPAATGSVSSAEVRVWPYEPALNDDDDYWIFRNFSGSTSSGTWTRAEADFGWPITPLVYQVAWEATFTIVPDHCVLIDVCGVPLTVTLRGWSFMKTQEVVTWTVSS